MAKWCEIDQAGFEEWAASRPKIIREMIASRPPDRLYRIGKDGHRVTIVSYNENGTVSVNVSGDYNFVIFERNVFGVKLDELVECNLPSPNEMLGAVLTGQKDVDEYIETVKRSNESGKQGEMH